MRQPQPDTHALPERPLVSVMVPVHDVERYLPQCVDSILAQDYDNLDIVLLGDGSANGCPAPWGKLFRPHLFDYVRYPDGLLYEDIRTTHRICVAADRAACIPDVPFHHRMREGSIALSHDAKNLVEYWHATLRQHNDAISVDDSLRDAMVRRCIYAIMRVWGWWITVPKDGRRQHLSVTRAVR